MKTEDYAFYFEKNKNSWNRRTPVHVDSDFYNLKGFLKGENSLNSIELELLGDIRGKSILHLQCHFGQDSISLARLGANVTAVDLSDVAIAQAKELSEKTSPVEFICCNVYDTEKHLDKKFDLVFASYGVVGWLPDLDEWARIISSFLKPGGEFVFVEFHPVVWMFDDNLEKVAYNYFNKEPIIETESGTYANRDADMKVEYVGWNHSLSEVVNNLIKHGLEIKVLDEHDFSPYNIFANPVEFEKGKFRVKHMDDKLPIVYSIKAVKK